MPNRILTQILSHQPHRHALAWVLPAGIALTGLSALAGFYIAGSAPDLAGRLLHEGGPVETLSALALLASALLLSPLLWRRGFAAGGYLPLLVAIMGMRELDFDKRFTAAGVLQARLYTGDYPLGQKLVGLMVVMGIVVLVVCLLRHCWRLWRSGEWCHLYPSLVLVAVGWLVLAKAIDGAGRKLAGLHIMLPPDWNPRLGAWEEILEMLAALVIYGIAMKCVTARTTQRADSAEPAVCIKPD